MSKRDGRSLLSTVNTVPTSTMLTLGLRPTQARRIIQVRRVLPLIEDRRTPCLDARKLWERIGKPHTRFRNWAEHYIRPMMARPGTNAEICAFEKKDRPGKPSKEYTLSRDVAANLAMMANTFEGEYIRAYFLDMEDLAHRLMLHLSVRITAIVETDALVTHMFRRRAGDDAKAGRIAKSSVCSVATEREKLLKEVVCDVLTGRSTGYWRETFRRGLRDVLGTEDAKLYAKCYETARAAVESGLIRDQAALRKFLMPSYGSRIDPARYRQAA
ncbi:hypothetical protein RT97_00255 [Variovorax paradoxus]|uniref:AntA/AntB antirepressor domain-containing protein n=1 Tax=Variovorax paradoxus TaxID=34073 RepID=A0A0D0N387_VARPD|nr:antA/AntB antirepressor family protein [Variovorax paradoxus]KIQ37554.1 hypothetical protein RT97_00255 [Variovorax paradoxus]